MNQQPNTSLANQRRALILDLDFTLLHLEAVPGSIEVPGRTRSAFIAPATVQALWALQDRFAIVLATARSWDGARWVSDGLSERGVSVAGAILEDGALLRSSAPRPQLRPLEEGRGWEALRAEFEARRLDAWPGFEWQRDFVACLVARAESSEEAGALMQAWAPLVDAMNQGGHELRRFRDGRKLYVAGRRADKWAALKYLLGSGAEESAGAGDGANDVCWLSKIALPCTMPGAAPQVLAAVREKGGFVSEHGGHAGIAEVLHFLRHAEIEVPGEPGSGRAMGGA